MAYLQSGPWTAGYSEALAAGGKGEPLELLANEFAALPFRMYIRYAFLQLRNLLTFVGVAFVLTLVSSNSYPFQSHHIMGWVMSAVFVMIGVIVARVFVQMDRDALLRRLTNTLPEKSTRPAWSFAWPRSASCHLWKPCDSLAHSGMYQLHT